MGRQKNFSEEHSKLMISKIELIKKLTEEDAYLIEFIIQCKIKSWYALKSLIHDACIYYNEVINPKEVNKKNMEAIEFILKNVDIWLSKNNLKEGTDNNNKAMREMYLLYKQNESII